MRITTQITWRCDIRCAHCNQEHLKVDLNDDLFELFLTWILVNVGLDEIGITGGEPFLKKDTIENISRFANEHSLPFSIITNGRWANKYDDIHKQLSKLQDMGLSLVTISTDKYHQKYVPIENLLNILAVCKELDIQTHIYSTLDYANLRENTETMEALAYITQEHPNVEISSRYSIPVGYSLLNRINTNSGFEISELNLTCPQRNQMTVWPNGDVLPCCTAGTHKNLAIGNILVNTPQEIYEEYQVNKILNLIRDYGVGALVSALSKTQRKEISSKKYISACHLCMEINSNLACRNHIKEMGGKKFDPLSIIFSV